MVHIVLLIQFTDNPKTKKWEDFSSIHDCCKYVCQMFEEFLKKANPSLSEITYDITDLYQYIDDVRRSKVCECILIEFYFRCRI